jgi:hypothetical protein
MDPSTIDWQQRNAAADNSSSYRVEVSGRDDKENFFVQKAMVDRSETEGKTIVSAPKGRKRSNVSDGGCKFCLRTEIARYWPILYRRRRRTANIPPHATVQWGLSAKHHRPRNPCSQLSVCEGSRASR